MKQWSGRGDIGLIRSFGTKLALRVHQLSGGRRFAADEKSPNFGVQFQKLVRIGADSPFHRIREKRLEKSAELGAELAVTHFRRVEALAQIRFEEGNFLQDREMEAIEKSIK